MLELNKKEYAKVLRLKEPNGISSIKKEKIDLKDFGLDSNIHRSNVYSTSITFYDGRIAQLIEKEVNRPEFKRAVQYESAVIKTFNKIQQPIFHYSVPQYVHNTNDTITTYRVEGTFLPKKIKDLDDMIKENAEKINQKTTSVVDKSLLDIRNKKIEVIKEAYKHLMLRALADLHYYGNLFRERLNQTLKNEVGREIYNPLSGNLSHYSNKMIENLKELFNLYEIEFSKELEDKLTEKNGEGTAPLSPIFKVIRQEAKDIIVYDFVPDHCIILPNLDLERTIEDFLNKEDKKVPGEELEVLKTRIAEEGRISITDFGDLRKGPELFDIIDASRNHLWGYKKLEIVRKEDLEFSLRERQNLRRGEKIESVEKMREDFLYTAGMIDVYRAARASVKTTEENRLIYLKNLKDELNFFGSLGILAPLQEILTPGIDQIIGKLEKKPPNNFFSKIFENIGVTKKGEKSGDNFSQPPSNNPTSEKGKDCPITDIINKYKIPIATAAGISILLAGASIISTLTRTPYLKFCADYLFNKNKTEIAQQINPRDQKIKEIVLEVEKNPPHIDIFDPKVAKVNGKELEKKALEEKTEEVKQPQEQKPTGTSTNSNSIYQPDVKPPQPEPVKEKAPVPVSIPIEPAPPPQIDPPSIIKT